MNLRSWLYTTNTKHAAFAEKLGISREHLCRVLSGKSRPSPKLAIAIQLITGGKVKASELLGLEDTNK